MSTYDPERDESAGRSLVVRCFLLWPAAVASPFLGPAMHLIERTTRVIERRTAVLDDFETFSQLVGEIYRHQPMMQIDANASRWAISKARRCYVQDTPVGLISFKTESDDAALQVKRVARKIFCLETDSLHGADSAADYDHIVLAFREFEA